MAKVDSDMDTLALRDRVHQVFDTWAPSHADGKILTQRKYNGDERYQWVELARFEPEPNLDVAKFLGAIGLGKSAYEKLCSAYEDNKVVGTVMDRHNSRKSTLIPTLHLRDIFDTAMTHNGLFVVSGGDKEFANINDLVANPMVSRLNLGPDETVMHGLLASGGIDMALPADAAKNYGMEGIDIQALERLYGPPLKERLDTGVAIHWSLPGSRGMRIITKAGETAMCVNRVQDGIANIARKRTNLAVPIPMDVRFGNCKLEMLKPRALDKVEDVHTMMEDMVEVASDLSGEKIYYGLPKGAVVVKV